MTLSDMVEREMGRRSEPVYLQCIHRSDSSVGMQWVYDYIYQYHYDEYNRGTVYIGVPVVHFSKFVRMLESRMMLATLVPPVYWRGMKVVPLSQSCDQDIMVMVDMLYHGISQASTYNAFVFNPDEGHIEPVVRQTSDEAMDYIRRNIRQPYYVVGSRTISHFTLSSEPTPPPQTKLQSDAAQGKFSDKHHSTTTPTTMSDCPQCGGKLKALGRDDVFCLDCEWDNIGPIDPMTIPF